MVQQARAPDKSAAGIAVKSSLTVARLAFTMNANRYHYGSWFQVLFSQCFITRGKEVKKVFGNKVFVAVAALVCIGLAAPVSASGDGDGRPEHFKGAPSETLDQALGNLREYNARLAKVLAGPVDEAAMVEVHELTYTLENALKRLDTEVEELAETLEKVHVGSEKLDRDAVQRNGRVYLENVAKLVR